MTVPDYPTPAFAFRVCRREGRALLSVVAGAGSGKPSWVARALAEPKGAWPAGTFRAKCLGAERHESVEVPAEDCTCRIYATTDLAIVDQYLSADGARPGRRVTARAGHSRR